MIWTPDFEKVDRYCNGLISEAMYKGQMGLDDDMLFFIKPDYNHFDKLFLWMEKGSFPLKKISSLISKKDRVSIWGVFAPEELKKIKAQFPKMSVLTEK